LGVTTTSSQARGFRAGHRDDAVVDAYGHGDGCNGEHRAAQEASHGKGLMFRSRLGLEPRPNE